MRAEVGVLSSAAGSAIFEMGNTKVLAAVFGPKPVDNRSEEDEKKAIVKCEYAMAVFSTGESRAWDGGGGTRVQLFPLPERAQAGQQRARGKACSEQPASLAP